VTALWPVSHAEQLIADPVDGHFIENPMFAKAHHEPRPKRGFCYSRIKDGDPNQLCRPGQHVAQ
jgi:hypothetical protein